MTWSQLQNGATRAASAEPGRDPASHDAGRARPTTRRPGTFSWDPGYPADAAADVVARPGERAPARRGHGVRVGAQHDHRRQPDAAGCGMRCSGPRRAASRTRTAIPTPSPASGSPETLTIWHDGRVVLRSLANTGIPVVADGGRHVPGLRAVPLPDHERDQPGRQPYSDPVSFVSYFNGGDAVHYFPRGSYGFQQSLGCVELPYNAAAAGLPVPDLRQPGDRHRLTIRGLTGASPARRRRPCAA